MLKLITLLTALILISGCAKNTIIGDSYCSSLIPMRAYVYLEDTDNPLFREIHGNMKRYELRCDSD